MILTLNFQSNIKCAISQSKVARLPRNEKQTYWWKSRSQMGPSVVNLVTTLTLNFQGQILNLKYLMTKRFDCHETKNEYIDWTLGLKCTHHLDLVFSRWNFLIAFTTRMAWPCIFKFKFWNSCISGLTLNKRDLSRSFMTIHDCDLLVIKVGCNNLPKENSRKNKNMIFITQLLLVIYLHCLTLNIYFVGEKFQQISHTS